MKKILLCGFYALIFLVSCNKTDIIDNAQQVGRSKITYYPTVALKGSTYMAVPVGGAYTDPGCTAIANGVSLPITISGTVNTSVAGVYALTYIAKNVDSFSASTVRFVAVYATDASAAAHDLSGNYARNTNGSVATWTKLAPGVYTVFNPGGAPGTNLTVIVFNQTGFSVKIPSQVASDGSITSSASESYTGVAPIQYSMEIVNPGYGTSVRTFIKQ